MKLGSTGLLVSFTGTSIVTVFVNKTVNLALPGFTTAFKECGEEGKSLSKWEAQVFFFLLHGGVPHNGG